MGEELSPMTKVVRLGHIAGRSMHACRYNIMHGHFWGVLSKEMSLSMVWVNRGYIVKPKV